MDAITLPRKRGVEITFEAQGHTFRVKRVSEDWMLTDPLHSPRARFGNRREILADIAHCVDVGALPPFSSPNVY